MQTTSQNSIVRRAAGENLWLEKRDVAFRNDHFREPFAYRLLEGEEAVGEAMLRELIEYASEKNGDVSVVLLGGRGAQAMYRRIAKLAETDEFDDLLSRLNVFTQDALAPMRMGNSLSF